MCAICVWVVYFSVQFRLCCYCICIIASSSAVLSVCVRYLLFKSSDMNFTNGRCYIPACLVAYDYMVHNTFKVEH